MLGNFKVNMAVRAPGLDHKRHIGFSWLTVALLDIALEASGNHVIPGISSAARARDNMIDCQVVSAYAAILTSVIIPMQNIAPG